MLSWPKLFTVLILPIVSPMFCSLTAPNLKVLPALLIWYSPERSGFGFSFIFLAKSLPIEQKNLFIVSAISCLSTILLPLSSFKLSILVAFERLLRSWLIVFQDSFMLPCCIDIFSEKYCLLSVRLRLFTLFLTCL